MSPPSWRKLPPAWRMPAALLVAWLALVAWRPFVFGFYHDDWTSVALPLDRSSSLLKLLAGDPSRPIYLLVLWVLRNVLQAHAWAWQTVLAIIHLACAWAVAAASNALFRSDGSPQATIWPGILSGVFWLAFPWSLGYSAWPVMLPPLIGLALAASSLALMARAQDRRALVKAALLLCLSWGIYEATWFFWVPPAILLAAGLLGGPAERRPLWTYTAVMAALQVAFIGLNRLLAGASPVSKQLSAQLLATLSTDQHLLQEQLLPQLQRGAVQLSIGIGVLAACAVTQAVFARRLFPLLMHATVALAGLAISVLLYAAAGYAIEWEGLFSRVTLAPSFWLALFLGALAHAAARGPLNPLRWLGAGAGALACAALGASLVQQSGPWWRSWDEQRAILRALPAQAIGLANPKTLILMDVPRGSAPVYTFSAFWDITGALVARMPLEHTVSSSTHAYATVLRPGEWRTSWDGSVLRQAWCSAPDSPLWQLSAERVFLWRYPGQEVSPVEPGFSTQCPLKSP